MAANLLATLLPAQRLAERVLCEASLGDFTRHAWPIVEPIHGFDDNWHINYVAEHLEAVDGGQIKRLAINVPRRTGKSIECTVMWPAWSWAKNPKRRWVFCSYGDQLSTSLSVKRRAVLESPWYRGHWGHKVQLAWDQNEKRQYRNTSRGEMLATSVGGAGAGFGGDYIVIDDPHNTDEAESDAERMAAIDFYDNTLVNCLDQPTEGAIVLVMQRVHVDDLTAHVMGHGGWTLVKIPADNHSPKTWVFTFPRSAKTHEMKPGDLFWPTRLTRDVLEDRKRVMGLRYPAQFDQEPVPFGGNVFHTDWWGYFEAVPPRTAFKRIFQSIDTGFKKNEGNSFTAIVTIGETWDKLYFILDVWWGRVEFPELVNERQEEGRRGIVVEQYLKWMPNTVLIEDRASGQSVIQVLRNAVYVDPHTGEFRRVPVLAVKADKDKLARAVAVSPVAQQGRIALHKGALWVPEFLRVTAKFDGQGADTDVVDAFVHGIRYGEGIGNRVSQEDLNI